MVRSRLPISFNRRGACSLDLRASLCTGVVLQAWFLHYLLIISPLGASRAQLLDLQASGPVLVLT